MIRNPPLRMTNRPAMTLVLLGPALHQAWPQQVKVIANPNIAANSITASELKAVFLEERGSFAGAHIEPVLARSGVAHEAILRHYLGMTNTALEHYYSALVFSGRGIMPRMFDSDAQIIAYVAKTRGAIGYINAETQTSEVRTLYVVRGAETSGRKLILRVEPDYPAVCRSNHIGGVVRLLVTIAPSGAVTDVYLRGGDEVLGAAASAALLQWKYSPAPSETTVELTLTFDPDSGVR